MSTLPTSLYPFVMQQIICPRNIMLSLLILIYFVNATLVQSLKIRAEDQFVSEDNVLTRRVHSLFYPSDPVCVFYSVSSESHDILDSISKAFSSKNILIVVETSFKTMLEQCKNVLILDISSSSVCDLFTKDKSLFLSLKYNIVLGYARSPANLTTLQRCSSAFDLALVKVMQLQSEAVFVLSSAVGSVRSFMSNCTRTTIDSQTPLVTSLKGRHLRVATFNFPPFSIIRENSNVVEYDGMEMNLFHQVSEYQQFSWGLVELKEPRPWGKLLPNNTVVGGLEQAIREDADVAFSNYWQRLEFLGTMDFGPPLNELFLTFLVRRPQRQHSRWQILCAIFRTEVWMLALLAFISVTATYWLGRSVRICPAKASLSESALIIFGLLTSSSSHAGPPRGLLLWWSFFALLFTTALTGSVVTRLAIPLFSPRLDTFRQAVERGYYWVSPGFYKRSAYLSSYMFNLHDSWQKKFMATYQSKEPHELTELITSDPKVMLPAQRWGNDFVILSFVDEVNRSRDLSDFRVMRETTRDVYTSFVFNKGSPLNELLTRATQSLIECGLWDYWKRTHTSKGDPKQSKQLMVEKDSSVLSQPEPFTLLKLYPVFVLLIIGNCLAFVVFSIELCGYKVFNQ